MTTRSGRGRSASIGVPLHIEIGYESSSDFDGVAFGLGFSSHEGGRIMSVDSDIPGDRFAVRRGTSGRVELKVPELHLQPGRYNMSAELQGFKKVNRQDVQLDAGARINVDFDLQTGELTEEVTVTAEAAPLQTDVALRKVVDSKDIEQMGHKTGAIAGSDAVSVLAVVAACRAGTKKPVD